MFAERLKELQEISHTVGNSPDYVQGGGGNTSVKLNDELMAVKASGFKLTQITPQQGFVIVHYKNIREYYDNVDLNSGIDYEKDSVAFVRQNVMEMEGLQVLRPSVEAGFHSVLQKYVIHSHSVYANIVCCAQNGMELVEKIFGDKGYECLWIPYINPGFALTLKIREGVRQCLKRKGKYPEVIFMENHGLIVSTDDCERTIVLHDQVNHSIREFFNISQGFPEIVLKEVGQETYISQTGYLRDFFKKNDVDTAFFEQWLCPDQLVYLFGNISLNGVDNKLNIHTSTGEIIYKTNKAQAQAMEETLLAFVYVVNKVKENGLMLKTMSEKEVNFIKNWESEKYRKSMVQKNH